MNNFLLIATSLLLIVNAEIINNSAIRNMIIPRGNYTQIRVSGFGFGDDSLENQIS